MDARGQASGDTVDMGCEVYQLLSPTLQLLPPPSSSCPHPPAPAPIRQLLSLILCLTTAPWLIQAAVHTRGPLTSFTPTLRPR